MSKSDRNRQEQLRDFVELCDRVGFALEPFQVKIAGALLGQEREKLVTLARKNGKSRLIGAFAAWHLLRTPQAQAIVVANSKEQARGRARRRCDARAVPACARRQAGRDLGAPRPGRAGQDAEDCGPRAHPG